MRVSSPNAADFSECAELQRSLLKAVEKLNSLAPTVAMSRHITTYDSDRRKRALAIAAMPLLTAGASSAAADTEARASGPYEAAMKQLGKEFVVAERALAEWDALRIQVDVLRSLLSLQKSQMTNL